MFLPSFIEIGLFVWLLLRLKAYILIHRYNYIHMTVHIIASLLFGSKSPNQNLYLGLRPKYNRMVKMHLSTGIQKNTYFQQALEPKWLGVAR